MQMRGLAESRRKKLASSSDTKTTANVCWFLEVSSAHLLVLDRTCRDVPADVRLGSARCCWGLARKKVVLFLPRGEFLVFVCHPAIHSRCCLSLRRPGVITMQALSEEDRRLWMEAMDGREPVSRNIAKKR